MSNPSPLSTLDGVRDGLLLSSLPEVIDYFGHCTRLNIVSSS